MLKFSYRMPFLDMTLTAEYITAAVFITLGTRVSNLSRGSHLKMRLTYSY